MTESRYQLKLPPIDANAFYRAGDLAKRYRVHVVTIWKWAQAGVLPPPVKLGPNTSRWFGALILENERRRSA